MSASVQHLEKTVSVHLNNVFFFETAVPVLVSAFENAIPNTGSDKLST